MDEEQRKNLANTARLLQGLETNRLLGEQAKERARIAGLPDCPLCGSKIPKIGAKICASCRNELAWVGHIPCEPNQSAIEAAKLEFERQEWEAKLEGRKKAKEDQEVFEGCLKFCLWFAAMLFTGFITASFRSAGFDSLATFFAFCFFLPALVIPPIIFFYKELRPSKAVVHNGADGRPSEVVVRDSLGSRPSGNWPRCTACKRILDKTATVCKHCGQLQSEKTIDEREKEKEKYRAPDSSSESTAQRPRQDGVKGQWKDKLSTFKEDVDKSSQTFFKKKKK